MAFVLVQHLAPSHESALPEILSRATKIPVSEIKDDVKLEPNRIYVIPANKILTINECLTSLYGTTLKPISSLMFFYIASCGE